MPSSLEADQLLIYHYGLIRPRALVSTDLSAKRESCSAATVMSGLPARATRLRRPAGQLFLRHASYSSSSESSSTPFSDLKEKTDIKPKSSLPPQKLRTLVSLYHQAEHFITRENLSQRIDDAFVLRGNGPTGQGITMRMSPETPLSLIRLNVEAQKRMPKFDEPNQAIARQNNPYVKAGMMWSDMRSPREMEVFQALYGVEGRGRPGYDVLKDEEERIRREWEIDEGEGSS